MADCSEQCAPGKEVTDIIFPANAVNLKQIAEQDLLYFFQLSKIRIVKNEHLVGVLQIFDQNDQAVLHGNLRHIAIMLKQLRVEHAPALLQAIHRLHLSTSALFLCHPVCPVLNPAEPTLFWEILIQKNRQLSRRLIGIFSFYIENFIFRTHREHELDRREHVMDAHIRGTDG